MNEPTSGHLDSTLARGLEQAHRDLEAVVSHQRLRAHPNEIAALALHAAVTALGSATQLSPERRVALARALLDASAAVLDDPDSAWFLGQRLARYDDALRNPRHPVHARAAHVFLDMLEVPDGEREAPATALGLMVMQYCGIFADAVQTHA